MYQYTCMTWFLVKQRDNFTSTWLLSAFQVGFCFMDFILFSVISMYSSLALLKLNLWLRNVVPAMPISSLSTTRFVCETNEYRRSHLGSWKNWTDCRVMRTAGHTADSASFTATFLIYLEGLRTGLQRYQKNWRQRHEQIKKVCKLLLR